MATIYTRAIKGSALTWAEGDANITNLNNAKLENIVEDLSPQLGGSLDVNGNAIVSAANGNITITPNGTGNIVLDGQNWPQAAPATNGEYLTATAAGQLSWTDRVNAKTIYETVKNVSGGSLTKGTPVYQVSVSGNTVTVAAARADDPTKLAIGILNETIADQAEGQMIVLGEIKGVNTSGFASGDSVYLGATGGYTNVPPTSSSVARQFLGVVFRVDANNGSGYITGTLTEDQVKYNGTGFELWNGTAWVTVASIVRSSISVTDTGGDGSLSYSSSTGVITYTGPTATDYRAAFSAGTGITITNGVIATTITQGITDIIQDTTPQLGGNLDVNGQQIVSVSNGNIVIAPNGTGKSKVNNINYYETPYSLGTTSGTITPDVANGNVQTITLNGNLTFSAFSNPVSGQSMTLIINTNGTGRTLTSTMKFAGGSKTISTTSTTDIISVFYDGTNYWASLSKDFK